MNSIPKTIKLVIIMANAINAAHFICMSKTNYTYKLLALHQGNLSNDPARLLMSLAVY